ncbi:hypothetical protein FQR65_LT12643 [Abscondita terminalis]|nr:hypothetical protein FQR65_LT12643 [Abscondita terminalis]
MGTIDELLPITILDTATIGLIVLGIIIVTSIVNAWLILPVVVIIIIFYYLRRVYIGTSRSIKRLDGVKTFGGNIGLIISQALMLTGIFQYGMRQITELENQMTSVERITEYEDIEVEKLNDQSKSVVKQNWPQNGKIEFFNLSLSYFGDVSPVLHNVSFKIEALQKVGIVGRTGAGKSSLIYALFRLADIEGTIFIDDIDTKTVTLQHLRTKISIIPQEPVLFSGTLRNNLDPFQEFNDDTLWDALEKVELKDIIARSLSGLDSEISEGGSNLSVGQRQLLCLARALLRKNRILILDEATANVDHVTDTLIQNTIRKQFTSCTVVVIAHRLDTIIDCDKILVMDAGQAVEFDEPHVLLQNVDGAFYKMLKETGKSKFQTLANLAKINYDKVHHEGQ